MSDNDEYLQVLLAQFWGSFGSGAGMPFNEECVEVATNKGYLETIAANASVFKKHPEQVERAMKCCVRAGHLAAERAIQEGRTTIHASDFVYACDEVEGRIARIRHRAANSGADPTILAGVCAALTSPTQLA